MPDDPRDILKAAGVECAEVDEWEDDPTRVGADTGRDAILALARLVDMYKWMAEHDLQVVLVEGKGARMVPGERSFQDVYDLGELYREHSDA